MFYARHALSTIVFIALAACAELGLEAPKTFADSLAYAYSQNTAVRASATQALQTGAITKSDASQVLTTTDAARGALDEARKIGCPAEVCLEGQLVPATALGKLQLASGLLTQLQTFLKSRGVK